MDAMKAVEVVMVKGREPKREWYVMCEKEGALENGVRPRQHDLKWYCRSCWFHPQERCYAYNDPEDTYCAQCRLFDLEAGWGHWLTEDEVPLELVKSWDRDHAPAEIRVLRERWPQASKVI